MEALDPKYKLPPKPPKRNQVVNIMVTVEEKKAIEKAAQEAGGTVSEYLRHLHNLATKGK